MNRKVRPIRIDGDIAYITLTKGRVAIIDAADVPLVNTWNWCAVERPYRCYAKRTEWKSDGGQSAVYLHRTILHAPTQLQIDHLNRNGLDNRRSNLRLATNAENQWNRPKSRTNTSGFKGVYWNKQYQGWRTSMCAHGKDIHLGYFPTAELAHAAYVAASKELHGEFSRSI